jgi:hypothetical protein
MPRKPRPTKHIVAFKVEPELAALLDAMPNKSEFIRAAVQSRLATACPLCRGSGIAPFGGVGDELAKLVSQHPLCVCAGCGVKEPRPCHTPGHCDDDSRVLVFERWGIFYCEACAAQMSFCVECVKPLGRTGKVKKGARCPECLVKAAAV